ncbi:LysR family transcriptional regulator [Conexibacter woesei]|uniref:Transcriptional regulator, LysR family n=1 Tax=Conexibacter woesei (strain DSM 14684 / CCUG 47730 / CIP 108061 / JCM 11494 / NBRC 100937 / ID131577) TaxID=469383 RepID=D3F6F0_CONWI|nr:LysR family transcriptional regulator [Conexibacter woesei]ADB50717.1 transcriptional regulator, LysR family [Conexibacter woesei DSM 14684]
MLDLRQLRVLIAIARHGSLTAAARALHYSQATVSHHLAALECEVGTRLVDRGRSGATLNDRGRTLVLRAEEIVERLELAREEVRQLAGLEAGLLRVGTFSTAGARLLPRAIARFRDAHPGVQVVLVEDEPAATVRALLAGELEMAIVYSLPGGAGVPGDAAGPGDAGDVASPLRLTHLLDDPMRLALPSAHLLASQERPQLADLARDGWITGLHGGAPCTELLNRACSLAGFSPRVVLRSDDYEVIRGFVAAGVGVALIPALGLTASGEAVAVRALAGEPLHRRVECALPRHGASATALELLATLMAVAVELAAG